MQLIKLTRLRGDTVRLNAEHISEVVPNIGDYDDAAKIVIVMANGYKYAVKQTAEQIDELLSDKPVQRTGNWDIGRS